MASLGTLGSFVGWMFLPGFATNLIQSFLYRLFTRAGDPIPVQGSPKFVRDYKRVYVFVILAYLSFTVYEVWSNITKKGNFYHMLGVGVDADDRMIKKHFRQLSVKYHPDKVGPSSEHIFVLLKSAFDTLSDPVKRFAYERLGPTILEPEWRLCHTYADYLARAAMSVWPAYVGSLLFLVILSGLGRLEFGKYWRFFFLFSMFFFEYAVLTRPHFLLVPRVLNFLTRRTLLPYEQLQLARQMLMTSVVAISQLGPIFQSNTSNDPNMRYAAQLERLQKFAEVTENMVQGWTTMELAPFMDETGAIHNDIKIKLKDHLIEERIKSQPELRDALGRVRQRRADRGPRLRKS